MIARRDFLKLSAASVAVSPLISGTQVFGGEQPCYRGIVYTARNSGKWTKKVGSHLPKVTIGNGQVTIVTQHSMSSKHYIVRHTLVLANGTVAEAKTFFPTDKPVSTHSLPAEYHGKILVTSFCNLHDLWVTEITV